MVKYGSKCSWSNIIPTFPGQIWSKYFWSNVIQIVLGITHIWLVKYVNDLVSNLLAIQIFLITNTQILLANWIWSKHINCTLSGKNYFLQLSKKRRQVCLSKGKSRRSISQLATTEDLQNRGEIEGHTSSVRDTVRENRYYVLNFVNEYWINE